MAGIFDWPGRTWRWIKGLPTPALAFAVLIGVGVLAGAGVSLYRTYDYIQHDNDFCMSCHLMADPFERFARSAHRGLGCKACHQPTFATRSRMALTQILEQPDTLGVHAEVPNARCESCHIKGDPEEWTLIENTAGHRVHLESDDPSLQGLTCVKCHSSSVHAFTPTDKTCGQAGCHEDVKVNLGKMANLTIHCATCHDFAKPVTGADVSSETLSAALRPQREECLTCHQMRSMLSDFPANDPHNGSCGSCHNPHTQTKPSDAVQSCTNCHTQPESITPYHRGLDPGVIDNCTTCHEAHSFQAHGGRCLDCHSDIYQDPGRPVDRISRAGVLHRDVAPAAHRSATTSNEAGMLPSLWAAMQQDTVRFRHAQHRDVDCLECHAMGNRHGALKITGLQDCRQCHHTQPVANRCTRCHTERGYAGRTYAVSQRLHFSAGPDVQRTLSFDHTRHQQLACSECHSGSPDLSAATITCDRCHDSHHRPDANCASCHAQAPRSAHPSQQVHTSCTTSGCHERLPLNDISWTRNLCLVCHQSMTDHRPGRNCVACHTLPPPQAMAPERGAERTSLFALMVHPLSGEGRP